MKTLLRFLFPLFALAFAGNAPAQNGNVQADMTTGLLWRPSTFLTNVTNQNSIFPSGGSSGQVLGLVGSTRTWISAGSGSGDVVGPSSSTDNALVRFDSTTGKLIQNSIGLLSDLGALSGLISVQTGIITSSGSSDLLINSGNDNRVIMSTTTTSGVTKLLVAANGSGTYPTVAQSANTTSFLVAGTLSLQTDGQNQSQFIGVHSGGTYASPTATLAATNGRLFRLIGTGYGATAYKSSFDMSVMASEDWTDTTMGTAVFWNYALTGTNTRTTNMVFSGLGNLLIGTSTDFGSGSGQLKVNSHALVGGNLTVSSLTATRVPFASTAGLIVDASTLTFNGASGALSATTFIGALTGNVTGNVSGSSGSTTGNAATATLAATVTVVDSTDATSFIAMFDSATGSLAPKTDGGLTYDATSGILTATGFAGPLTGNVTGNVSGSSGSTTGNASTVTTNANLTGPVTSVGNATAITDGSVVLADLADLAQDQFIGRTTASTGVPQTATITAAARTVLDDTTVGAMVDTLGGASATGTGGLARANSPVFVTPTLGTPVSGVGTNFTGIPEGGLSLTDIATNNVSTTKHGFAPKAPNDATKFLDGTGAYSVPAGGAAVANPGSQVLGLTAINGSASTAMRSDGAPALDVTIAPNWSNQHIHSKSGAASITAETWSGVPFAGTGTTSFPLVYINDTNATASTTLNTAGTYFGVNGDGTQDLINIMKDGVSQFKISSTGAASVAGALTYGTNITSSSSNGSILPGQDGYMQFAGRTSLRSLVDGSLVLRNNADNNFTILQFGGTTNSFNAIGRDTVNSFTIQSAAATATYNDAATAGSGTVANAYVLGIAAPTKTATNATVTHTVDSTVYIGGAPTASTNLTIGAAYSLNVAAGTTFLQALRMGVAAPLSVVSGTNQRAGNATLTGGTVTVNNTTVTASSILMLTRKTSGGTIGTAITYTTSAATSFTINSDNILDTSVFSYFIVEVP